MINKPSLLSLHQVYITFKSDDLEDLETARGTLEQCIVDVNNWTLQNNLKLNQDQSELIDIHAKNRLKPSLESIQVGESTIHLIPKCRPINYSFVYMLISSLCLVSMYKTQKNFDVKMRQKGLINMRTKEYFICLHFGIRCIVPSDSARKICVIFDSTFSLDSHIIELCKTAFYHLRNLSKIRSI